MKKRTFIYVLKHPISLEIRYIGKTVQKLSYRLKQHLLEKSNTHKNCWIKSIKKLGLIPIIEEIDSCDWDKSAELEIYYIKKYREEGYSLINLTDGGDGTLGYKPTKETLEKMSKTQKEKYNSGYIPPMKGKKHTLESREKISIGNKGLKRSLEFREKRRKIMTGSKASPETTAKIIKHHYIPIVKLDLDGNLIKKYDFLKQATKDGYTESKLIDCLKGRTKKYKGFKWMYLKEFDELPKPDKIDYSLYGR